jgi:hypothetical protein
MLAFLVIADAKRVVVELGASACDKKLPHAEEFDSHHPLGRAFCPAPREMCRSRTQHDGRTVNVEGLSPTNQASGCAPLRYPAARHFPDRPMDPQSVDQIGEGAARSPGHTESRGTSVGLFILPIRRRPGASKDHQEQCLSTNKPRRSRAVGYAIHPLNHTPVQ